MTDFLDDASASVSDALDAAASAATDAAEAVNGATQSAVSSAANAESDKADTSLGAVTAAGQEATGTGKIVVFATWLGGDLSERTFSYTLGASSMSEDEIHAAGIAVTYDEVFYPVFADAVALHFALQSASGWVELTIPDLDWTLWFEGGTEITAAIAESTIAYEALSQFKIDRNVLEAAYEQQSPNEALHTALNSISLVAGLVPHPIAQAVSAGAGLADAVVYVDEGNYSVACSGGILILLPEFKESKAIYDESAELIGYSFKKVDVARFGVTGMLKRLMLAKAALKLRFDVIWYIEDLGVFGTYWRSNQQAILDVMESFASSSMGEQAIYAAFEAPAYLHATFGLSLQETEALVTDVLAKLKIMAPEAERLPGLQSILDSLQIADERNIKGALFELDWAVASLDDLVEIGAMYYDADTKYLKAGADAVHSSKVVELKSYAEATLEGDPTGIAADFAAQVRQRLETAFYDPNSGTVKYPAYANIELVLSSSELKGGIPAEFAAAMEAELEALRLDFAYMNPTLKVYAWP